VRREGRVAGVVCIEVVVAAEVAGVDIVAIGAEDLHLVVVACTRVADFVVDSAGIVDSG